MKRNEAIISIDAICKNYINLTKNLDKSVTPIAVIKANAYGHGDVAVAKALWELGARKFAVATVEEGLNLRKHGIEGQILVLGIADKEDAKACEQAGLTLSVSSYEYAKEILSAASPEIQIQIDSGMSRLGIYCHSEKDVADAAREAAKIYSISKPTGIYTHFAKADTPSSSFTENQFTAFKMLIDTLQKMGYDTGMCHCCNSPATVNFEKMHLNAIRLGISLYGYTTGTILKDIELMPAMTFKTKLIKVSYINEGDSVGYDCTFKAERKMKIAVCSVGYADGLPRALSNKGVFKVNGKDAKILGRVCMDLTMIDVSDIECSEGDEAIIFGEGHPATVNADLGGTISYELLCAVSSRVPKKIVSSK